MGTPVDYSASLAIDRFDGIRNKLTTFFRPFAAIPILIILGLLDGMPPGWTGFPWEFQFPGVFSVFGLTARLFPVGGLVVGPTVLMLLFQQKYPRWWFDWNLAIFSFFLRVASYMMLLRDEYPSTDEEQAVHLDIPYPDAFTLSRGLPLVKWLLAIPHLIVLAFLSVAVWVCVIIAWFAILFTGKYPEALQEFVVGFLRWHVRVTAYAIILSTDEYPTFSLD